MKWYIICIRIIIKDSYSRIWSGSKCHKWAGIKLHVKSEHGLRYTANASEFKRKTITRFGTPLQPSRLLDFWGIENGLETNRGCNHLPNPLGRHTLGRAASKRPAGSQRCHGPRRFEMMNVFNLTCHIIIIITIIIITIITIIIHQYNKNLWYLMGKQMIAVVF